MLEAVGVEVFKSDSHCNTIKIFEILVHHFMSGANGEGAACHFCSEKFAGNHSYKRNIAAAFYYLIDGYGDHAFIVNTVDSGNIQHRRVNLRRSRLSGIGLKFLNVLVDHTIARQRSGFKARRDQKGVIGGSFDDVRAVNVRVFGYERLELA